MQSAILCLRMIWSIASLDICCQYLSRLLNNIYRSIEAMQILTHHFEPNIRILAANLGKDIYYTMLSIDNIRPDRFNKLYWNPGEPSYGNGLQNANKSWHSLILPSIVKILKQV